MPRENSAWGTRVTCKYRNTGGRRIIYEREAAPDRINANKKLIDAEIIKAEGGDERARSAELNIK